MERIRRRHHLREKPSQDEDAEAVGDDLDHSVLQLGQVSSMSNTNIHSDYHDADGESQRPQAAQPASQRASKPELGNS
jgi:hypothetical protein